MKEDKLKILFDSNVIIDAISDRENNEKGAKNLFLMVALGKVEGYLASKQLTDIYYVLRKFVPNIDVRKQLIDYLTRAFNIIPLTGEDVLESLKLNGHDFEDDLLIYLAGKNQLDYIATNNLVDFKGSEPRAVLPSYFKE